MKNKIVIGLVGKIGCGKSTIAGILAQKYGYFRIDTDEFGHVALDALKKKLKKEFGKEILDNDGNVDRNALGRIVFSDLEKLTKLNSIVHPSMRIMIETLILESKEVKFVIDAALLFEIGLDRLCNYIVAVEAPEYDVYKRVETSRHWDKEKIFHILKSQEKLQFIRKKKDFYINNDGDMNHLIQQIQNIITVIQ